MKNSRHVRIHSSRASLFAHSFLYGTPCLTYSHFCKVRLSFGSGIAYPYLTNSSVPVHLFSHCKPKVTRKPQCTDITHPYRPRCGFSTFAPRARFKMGAFLPYRPRCGFST